MLVKLIERQGVVGQRLNNLLLDLPDQGVVPLRVVEQDTCSDNNHGDYGSNDRELSTLPQCQQGDQKAHSREGESPDCEELVDVHLWASPPLCSKLWPTEFCAFESRRPVGAALGKPSGSGSTGHR